MVGVGAIRKAGGGWTCRGKGEKEGKRQLQKNAKQGKNLRKEKRGVKRK